MRIGIFGATVNDGTIDQVIGEWSRMNVADTIRSLPTSWWANSSLHVPPCSATIACSAAIQ